MAHSLSAKKRIRQTLKRRARNRARKEQLKGELKNLTTAIGGGDAAKAETEFRTVSARLAKIAAKGTIHKNTAARQRSRLAKKVNSRPAAGSKAATGGATAGAAGAAGA